MASASIRLAFACVEGRSHRAKGCEDAGGMLRIGRRGGIIALADGAGSAAYAASGAATAVSVALAVIARNFAEIHATPGPTLFLTPLVEALTVKAAELECRLRDLACTLLVAAAVRHGDTVQWLTAHIGDGVIAADFGDGLALLSPPENGEFSSSTYFVTDVGAADHFRLSVGIAREATFVVMTDGAAESLFRRADQTLAPAVTVMAKWAQDVPSRRLKSILTKNLIEVIRPRTMDDASLGLLRIGGYTDSVR